MNATLERIAKALERIADVLEASEKRKVDYHASQASKEVSKSLDDAITDELKHPPPSIMTE